MTASNQARDQPRDDWGRARRFPKREQESQSPAGPLVTGADGRRRRARVDLSEPPGST